VSFVLIFLYSSSSGTGVQNLSGLKRGGEGIYANVSPGTMAIQTITTRYRKVAPKNFRFGFMGASAIDCPLEPDESIEHNCAHLRSTKCECSAREFSGKPGIWELRRRFFAAAFLDCGGTTR
jgi:hypothetical protein